MNVIVFLAAGFEEVEALTVVDYLRRIKQITAEMVSIGADLEVSGSHGIQVKADKAITDLAKLDQYAAIIIPGGMPGATNLRDDKRVIKVIKEMNEMGKLVAAICAGPLVLEKAQIITGKEVTSYPGFEAELAGSIYKEDDVVIDGNIITSRGPGKAVDFALAIVKELVGAKEAEKLRKEILYDKN